MLPCRARFRLLLPVVVASSIALSGGPAFAPAATADDSGGGRPVVARGYDEPYSGFAPARQRWREGTPRDVGLPRGPIDAALAQLRGFESSGSARGGGLYPGSVAVVGHRGRVIARQASGYAVLYGDASGTPLPPERRVAATGDTLYDLASVTKIFTAILLMQEVERGEIDLDEPVATYLPEFAVAGKEAVTVRQLLTHTSGFEPFIPLWKLFGDKETRIAGVLAHPLKRPPGTAYVYSDLNLITLGVLLERRTGTPLDELVTRRITAPLGMDDTGYNPPASSLDRIAATEFDAALGRGIVRGQVHDENAASLGGVAGHAGIFSTVDDLSRLAQALLGGGALEGRRILRADTVTAMMRNQVPEFPTDDHGLGVELDQAWYMGGLAGPHTAGHTGFTGTSLVIDVASRSYAILLTNRVHPARDRGSINPARRALASGLADALPVRPRAGETALRAGTADATTATATLHVEVPQEGAWLSFETFVANDVADAFVLERSTDAGVTWTPVRVTLTEPDRRVSVSGDLGSTRGTRHWQRARADLRPGDQLIRWRHTTDATTRGRGVYVDDVRVTADGRVLLDAERDPAAITTDGWAPSTS